MLNSSEHPLRHMLHAEQVTRHTHISVMFSLSCGARAGTLVILSESMHTSMVKEHLHVPGQPPRAGGGARLARASSTRGRGSARARAASAMLTKTQQGEETNQREVMFPGSSVSSRREERAAGCGDGVGV